MFRGKAEKSLNVIFVSEWNRAACYRRTREGFVGLSVHTANRLLPVTEPPCSFSQCLPLNYPSFLLRQGPSQITAHCLPPIGLSSCGSMFQNAAHCAWSREQRGPGRDSVKHTHTQRKEHHASTFTHTHIFTQRPISSGASWLCDPDVFLSCQQYQNDTAAVIPSFSKTEIQYWAERKCSESDIFPLDLNNCPLGWGEKKWASCLYHQDETAAATKASVFASKKTNINE